MTTYHEYRPTRRDNRWARKDTLVFTLPRNLPAGIYDVDIALRHTNNYKFRDIWLLLEENGRDSLRFSCDTVHAILTDEHGRWKKDNTSGSLYTHIARLPRQMILTQSAHTHTIRLQHIMRMLSLEGVADVGVKLTLARRIKTQKDKKQNGKTP